VPSFFHENKRKHAPKQLLRKLEGAMKPTRLSDDIIDFVCTLAIVTVLIIAGFGGCHV